MYFLNYLHTITNLDKLVQSTLQRKTNGETLSKDYRDFVQITRKIPVKSGCKISFEDDELGSFIQNQGIFDDVFSKIFKTSKEERIDFENNVKKSLDYIRDIDYRLSWIVETLVTDIVLFQSDRFGGGSASHLPGVVCISPNEKWEIGDFAESILHEATHLNLFLCDMVNSLFKVPLEELEKDEARVVSAVRIGQLRPLDKALHSAVVAVPLMYMQNITNQTTLVDLFTDSLKTCSEGLLKKEEYFTEYGLELVNQLHKFATNQNFEDVKDAIGNKKFAASSSTIN